MIKKIGRSRDNDIVINVAEISSHHATLTLLEDGSYLLEDLSSTNGSFVNGKKIKKTTVTNNDIIKFAHYQFNLQTLLDNENKIIQAPRDETEQTFYKLKEVYDNYITTKLELLNTSKKGNIIRGLLSFIPVVGSGLSQMSMTVTDKQEKLVLLEEEFKTTYCCPKCNYFLGPAPWSNLEKRNKCPSCKESWIKK
jgi:pSer/pThr/pTyr-binding forkhead associated (FHA) protein